MTFVSMRIAGAERAATTGRTFRRLNPVTGEVASEAVAATVADAVAAADAAAAAFPAWAALGPNARRAILLKAADALAAKGDAVVAAMASEIGATVAWARFNVMLASSMLREAAALTTQVSGEVIPSDKPGCLSMAIREPAGVVLGIAPWNAPVILGVRAVATPLACGNSVVFKASEICPRTHALIVEALEEGGLPAGVVSLVTNAPEDAAEIVGALIDHPDIRRINFTGSTNVGRIIAERAARQLKPVLLELGGKAPLLVLKDADVDEAVKAAIFGAFFNQGQICMSTERIIVVPEVAEEFVVKFTERAKALKAGDPREGKAPLGAVVDARTVEKVEALIADAVSKGATVTGAGAADGVLLPAQVVDKVTSDMRLYSEESFGPVVAILRAKDEDDAVRLTNDSEYGLSAAVFSRDTSRALSVARRIRSGICHVNGPTVHDEAQMPFGGTKASGYGRFGGKAGIAEFTELRWITVETQPGHFPL
ncbi:aldehyde dehydrogenase [Rhizobium lentis]|uniref:Aldehyde dehydrogenase n=1 Tax=Rhizobium lentis TaxID=1138194 RepID=A0A9Q3M724_9HYPH|nr:aldehyde dehydrogenase [Rhizobium lentis]MBX4957044.1 aldehyde dehydrogenase [Rhizobium lentis]MBX4976141.1 aldehyde dehydrogenase [Rhizobium lentis]MBX4986740.1 aldehyde dehydrogenase [Rhizobium lentis]MBX5005184.1 aldehyde dehydrogenase [Rhizobium lentis]MBX5022501.1 aldehyde dehydrogenase [Rhizobium lentis]